MNGITMFYCGDPAVMCRTTICLCLNRQGAWPVFHYLWCFMVLVLAASGWYWLCLLEWWWFTCWVCWWDELGSASFVFGCCIVGDFPVLTSGLRLYYSLWTLWVISTGVTSEKDKQHSVFLHHTRFSLLAEKHSRWKWRFPPLIRHTLQSIADFMFSLL